MAEPQLIAADEASVIGSRPRAVPKADAWRTGDRARHPTSPDVPMRGDHRLCQVSAMLIAGIVFLIALAVCFGLI